MSNKLVKVCVRKWQRWNQTQGSRVPTQWACPSTSMDLKCLKNKARRQPSFHRLETELWKSLGIHTFNMSSRWFLRSSKCGNHCFISQGLLSLGCGLATQLSVSVNTFRDLPGIRDGWRPYSHTNILLSMWYVSMKASRMPTPLEIQTLISRQTGTKSQT